MTLIRKLKLGTGTGVRKQKDLDSQVANIDEHTSTVKDLRANITNLISQKITCWKLLVLHVSCCVELFLWNF